MTKYSSFLLTLVLVIFFLGIKEAIIIYVVTFVVLYILYKIKPGWFKPFDSFNPEDYDDFNDIEL